MMRNIVDQKLITADGRSVARVADAELEWRPDGTLRMTHLLVGPQRLAGQVSNRFAPLLRHLLHDRFEHRIPVAEISRIALDISLRKPASRYRVGSADQWVVDHILRFIPGNGR